MRGHTSVLILFLFSVSTFIPASILVLVPVLVSIIVVLVSIVVVVPVSILGSRLKDPASNSHAVNAFRLVDGSVLEAVLESLTRQVRKPRCPQRRKCSPGAFIPTRPFGNHHRNRDHQLS